MSTFKSIVRFLYQSVGLGLIVAAIIFLIQPYLQNDGSSQFNLSKGDEVASFNQAISRAAPAVVNIYSLGESERSRYSSQANSRLWRLGSGVIMSERGYIITANHVVENYDEIQVALQDGRRYEAQLIGNDTYTDLAVLKVEADNLPVIPTMGERSIKVGDIVFAIGNPYNIGQTITQGIISATGGRVGITGSAYSDLIQMDAVINQGASGGALINSKGELIGINNARFNSAFGDTVEGIYFATPYNIVNEIMQILITEGRVVRGYIGIQVNPNFNLQNAANGILVTLVEPNSPADQAGLKVNDLITQIGGAPIYSATEGMERVVKSRPGTQLEIEYVRGDETRTTTLTVGSARQIQ